MDLESVVDEEVNAADLKKFADLYEKQIDRGMPSTKAAFEYAYCLIRSNRQHVRMGVELLEDLLQREDAGIEKRDYLYYLAMAYLRLKEYDKAANTVKAGLRVEEKNQQFLDLQALIEKRRQRDALKGAAILGGAAFFGGALLAGAVATVAIIAKRGGGGGHSK